MTNHKLKIYRVIDSFERMHYHILAEQHNQDGTVVLRLKRKTIPMSSKTPMYFDLLVYPTGTYQLVRSAF